LRQAGTALRRLLTRRCLCSPQVHGAVDVADVEAELAKAGAK
jgi:hypothetical protein